MATLQHCCVCSYKTCRLHLARAGKQSVCTAAAPRTGSTVLNSCASALVSVRSHDNVGVSLLLHTQDLACCALSLPPRGGHTQTLLAQVSVAAALAPLLRTHLVCPADIECSQQQPFFLQLHTHPLRYSHCGCTPLSTPLCQDTKLPMQCCADILTQRHLMMHRSSINRSSINRRDWKGADLRSLRTSGASLACR